MALLAPDPIFKGVTPAGAVRALGKFLQGKDFARYIVPCAGNMTIPEALAVSGVPADRIEASDITLYTSALGYLCDPEKSVVDLGFTPISAELANLLKGLPSEQDVQSTAQILYAIKWTQLQGGREYVKWQRLEFERQAEAVHAYYVNGLVKLQQRLGGMHYAMEDCFDAVRAGLDDPGAFIYFNPPGYKGGYSKMFDPRGHYKWSPPDIEELDPKTVDGFLTELVNAQATVMVFGTEGHALDKLPEAGWEKLYTELNPKTGRRTYLATNSMVDRSILNRRRFWKLPEKVPPVYDEHEITKASKIAFIKTNAPTALYFYDAFVRELGMVKAEVYYLFCVDGQVAGTCGFDIRTHIIKREPTLYETFGLSMTSTRHARIGRLLMKALCCREFIDQFTAENVNPSLLLPPLTDIQTTCLTKFPEAKKNRGILKLIGRTQLPNGRFHLIYRTKVHELTFQQVLDEWVEKHADKER